MTATATAAIVGRPNVGKSTLFNRLVGRRQALVHDQPGVTRDRIFAPAPLPDGGSVVIVDTGGLVPGEDPIGLNQQVLLAVEESDLVLFVVDGRDGLTSADEQVWDAIRRFHRPVLLVVNKGDTRAAQTGYREFYRLGAGDPILVSAEHGRGVDDLLTALANALPGTPPAERLEAPAVAIVGRPNVGKSSLLNQILGEKRVLVSPRPGTTRDPIDTLVRRGERSYLLIDTAGIRRRSRTEGTPEDLAIMFARRQIERAAVCLLVLDGAQGVTSGDLAIAGAVWELGRAAVAVVNKWDLVAEERRRELEVVWPRLAQVLAGPRRVNVSALTGRGVERIFRELDGALEDYGLALGTGEVNRLFQDAVRQHQAPSLHGRPWKLYYATQVASGPPTFMVFANRTLSRGDGYRRYLENRLREELGLPGVPLRLVIRRRREES